jgi:hypothetical protein
VVLRRQPEVIRTGLIFYPEIVRMLAREALVLVLGNRRAVPCLGNGDMMLRFSALPVVEVPRLVDLQEVEVVGENRGPVRVEVGHRHRPCCPLVNEAGTDTEVGVEEMPMMVQLKVRLAIIRAAR